MAEDLATDTGPIDLRAAASQLLEVARAAHAGRAAMSLTPGAGSRLTQTVLALVAGQTLADHTTAGSATLQVLEGDVTLVVDATEHGLSVGEWAVVPRERHGLHAETDAAVLLTVATESR